MEEPQLFMMDHSYNMEKKWSVNNNYESTHDSSSILSTARQQDSEEELEMTEKELFLCSQLGIFLLQEVDNLLEQKKNLVNDHTKVLLDLQSYETLKKSYLDIADTDGGSEFNDTLSTLSPDSEYTPDLQFLKSRINSTSLALESTDKLAQLQNQIFDIGSTLRREALSKTSVKLPVRTIDELQGNHGTNFGLRRSGSVDSITEVQSIPESTLTSVSHATKNLQSSLDKLHRAHERITRLEVQLDSTRAKYRTLMTEYSRKLKEMSQSLGTCVDRARPYFTAVMKSRKAQAETQQAAIQYKRAVNLQKAGRDMVRVAEERLVASSDKFDTTWQEMLNQATLKVNEASREKDRIHAIHMKAANTFKSSEEEKDRLQETLQRSIVRAKPYFEVQQDFQTRLEAVTKRLNSLEVKLMEARQLYSDALSFIRQSGDGEGSSIALDSLAERGIGVGAENPYMDGSVLPRPMQDILRMEASNKPKSSKASLNTEHIPTCDIQSSRFQYNPYDLMYLKDTSDNGSIAGSGCDEYIQDF